MSKHKIICLALCGLMLTSCGNGEEDTVTETVLSETSQTSESVSEAAKTEAEIVTETEVPESLETVPEKTESTLNYDKVKDRVIFDDGTQNLTAGEYIDAVMEGKYYESIYYGFQFMDMDENLIPEILFYYESTMSDFSKLYTITLDGKMLNIPIINHDICTSYEKHDECYCINGGSLKPYEKDGETLWIGGWEYGSAGGGSSGEYILKYNGSGIDSEVIHKETYERYEASNNNGIPNWDYYQYYYIFGEEVTEAEYDRRRDEYMNSLKPSDELYVELSYGIEITEYEFRENLSDALNKYLDMRNSEGSDNL